MHLQDPMFDISWAVCGVFTKRDKLQSKHEGVTCKRCRQTLAYRRLSNNGRLTDLPDAFETHHLERCLSPVDEHGLLGDARDVIEHAWLRATRDGPFAVSVRAVAAQLAEHTENT